MSRPVLLAATALLFGGCLSLPPTRPDYRLFEPVARNDVFEPAISRWQLQHKRVALARDLEQLRDDLGAEVAPVVSSGPVTPLALEYARFQGELRRRIVEQTVRWVQTQSGLYYRPDGTLDQWPVLDEVLHSGGDDCDGFDVLTFSLLRALGFESGEIYRAILRDLETDQHHMVTLWFEGGAQDDPWVLDPTGEVTPLLARLSARHGWVPVRLFDEDESFATAVYSDLLR